MKTPNSAGFAGPNPGSPSRDCWPDPGDLRRKTPEVVPFDLDLLPASLQPWIGDVAERMQCPPDYAAVGAVIGLSTVVGRKIGIRPKAQDDWLVVPNLWGIGIGRPSVLKTPAIQEALRPLHTIEKRSAREFEKAMEGFEAEQLVAKAGRAVSEGRIRAALEKKEDARALAAEVIQAAPQAPVRKRLITNDSTVEKLGELLRENPYGLLVYRDELPGLLRSLDKEGHESARGFYLEAWNGTGRYVYDRIGRGTIEIEAAILSLIGTCQPGPLLAYLRAAIAGGSGDDGLVQRFQLMVLPDQPTTWVNVDRQPDATARAQADQVYERLHELDVARIAGIEGLDSDVPYLRFDEEAQAVLDSWRVEWETERRTQEDHPAIESHFTKYRSLVPSLALVFHLADAGEGPVGIDALKRALRWIPYLEAHARRVYGLAIDAEAEAAWTLSRHLIRKDLLDGFTTRDVYNRGWTGLGTRDEAAAAVARLVDAGWLRPAPRQPGATGRPPNAFEINPKIFLGTRGAAGETSERGCAASAGSAPGSSVVGPRGMEENPPDTSKSSQRGSAGFAGSDRDPGEAMCGAEEGRPGTSETSETRRPEDREGSSARRAECVGPITLQVIDLFGGEVVPASSEIRDSPGLDGERETVELDLEGLW